jgi:ankyrin repeat protein
LVKTLVENKALVNLLDEDGNTPLHTAAHNLHPAVVLFLLEKGADVKIQN